MPPSNAPKKTSRQLKAERTKKKLIDVSLKLIREQGFEQVKISDICKEAHVSTGAFYHHIKNKAGIVIEGYAECDRYFADTVYPALKNRCDSDAVLEYIDHQMRYAESFGVDFCIQIYKAQLTEGTEFFLSLERALPAGLVLLTGHLQQQGLLSRCKSNEAIVKELLVLSRGILYNWCQCNGRYDLRSFAREMIGNYLKAYLI